MSEKTPHSNREVVNLRAAGYLAEEWADAFTQVESTIRMAAKKYGVHKDSLERIVAHVEGHLITALNEHEKIIRHNPTSAEFDELRFAQEAQAGIEACVEEYLEEFREENRGNAAFNAFVQSIAPSMMPGWWRKKD